jgi:hypothetical protein
VRAAIDATLRFCLSEDLLVSRWNNRVAALFRLSWGYSVP